MIKINKIDKPILVFIILLSLSLFLVIIFIINMEIEEQKVWKTFAKEHNCKIVEETQSSFMVVGAVTVYEKGKECYLCDDGKKYWRNKK